MRRAKIVCTLGPAVSGRIEELVDAGMDVARLNLSHGSYDEHEAHYDEVRAASDAPRSAVGVLVDLQGPKIRLGTFADGPVTLDRRRPLHDHHRGRARQRRSCVSTTYKGLPGDCRAGRHDPGRRRQGGAEGRRASTGPRVITRVEVGGPVSNHKGLNLPGVAVSVPALSDKDEDDLRWALRMGADLVALSFVRNADDVDDVHKIMDEEGRRVPVIAKIEKPQAVDNLEEIVQAFDGIMVARGDLGVELPLEQVPMVQKRAVELARRAAKPVIVATQVLDSMITLPAPDPGRGLGLRQRRPRRRRRGHALGETSVGPYPFEAVRTMARIIETTEDQALDRIPALGTRPTSKGGAITFAAAAVGELLRRQVPGRLHHQR